MNSLFRIFCLFALMAAVMLPASRTYAADTEGQPLYFKTTADNILKAFWRMKNVDTDNDENIDQFLLVNECSLYTQFFEDEFEWNKIRAATKKYIKANINSFPQRFEIVQPITLDRYNELTKSFDIVEKDQIIGVTKMEVSWNDPRRSPCLEGRFKYREFPINAILNLSRPLDYTHVPVTKEMVKEYSQYLKENGVNVTNGRPAFIRYRFKVEQSIGITVADTSSYANFYGTLESFTVFGDRSFFIKFDEKIFN